MIDENELIKNIVLGVDLREVITSLVIEEEMDPWAVDIVKITNSFMSYLKRLKEFDFRIPGRFILVAAILLRMKCELLLEEEEQKKKIEGEQAPGINIEGVPSLVPPIERKPTRKVTLSELVAALNKAIVFKEKKEHTKFRLRRAVETLITPEEDIEVRMKNIFDKITVKGGYVKFSELVPTWKPVVIVETFVPLLHLLMRGRITCNQEELFKEIYIKVLDEVS